jgi:outer membrane protein TolC
MCGTVMMQFNRQVAPWLLFAALTVVVSGCSTSRRMARMDRRVQGYLETSQQLELEPDQRVNVQLDAYRPFGEDATGKTLHVNLRTAMELASRHSREYQSAKEDLYSTALALVVAAHDWEWHVTNSWSTVLARDFAGPDTTFTADADVGFSRRLLSGARLTTSLAVDSLRYLSGDRGVDIGSLASVTLTQPLLSGYGPLVARESLTQAERNLIYALRAYVRTKKSLLITISERYYGVLSAHDSLLIAQQNYENLTISRQRSEALAESGRVPVFQVDQARQKELSANSSVISREEEYQASKDDLKRVLGLPLSVEIETEREDLTRLVQASLPEPPMSFDAACEYALAHRLDFATVNGRLADAERRVLIRFDETRARLDLVLTGRASSPADDHLRTIDFDKGRYSVGLDGSLPFDRTDELAAYRLAQIAEAQRRRDVSLEHDRIVADLRSVWRRLASARQNYEIQRLSVDLAEKRIESTELLFEAGRVNIREVLDARDSLIIARNAVTLALVNHRLSWLRLLYQLEQLPTEPGSLWSPALDIAGS